MDFGPMELLLVLGIVVLLFGPGKVAGLGGALGNSVREFRRAVRGGDDDDDEKPAEAPPAPAPTVTQVAARLPQPPAADFVPTTVNPSDRSSAA